MSKKYVKRDDVMFSVTIVIAITFFTIALVFVFKLTSRLKPPVTIVKLDNYYSMRDDDNYELPILIAIDSNSDLDVVESIIYEANYHLIDSRDSKPIIRYRAFNETYTEFIVVLKIKDSTNKYNLTKDFLRLIKKRFDKKGIKILFPINTDLHPIS